MSDLRPFRFASSRARIQDMTAWGEFVRKVDDQGFDVVQVADHLGALSPAVALTAAAGISSRLRLGTFVLNNDFRHPTIVAQEAATLDLMSDGRYELGIGAGWNEPEYAAAGVSFDAPMKRIRRLEESVVIMRRLFAGERLTFEGSHYSITDHPQDPVPPQGADLPVLIGGNGDYLLGVAARNATIVGFTGFTHRDGVASLANFSPEGFANRVEHVAAQAGTRMPDIELNVLVQQVLITEDPLGAAEELAIEWASDTGEGPDAATIMGSPFIQIGSAASIADDLRQLRETTGVSFFTFFDGRSDGVEAVVALLAGE